MPISKETLIKNIISIRKRCYLSQADVANQLGISQQAYAKWESGVVVPDVLLLDKLAGIYRCSIKDLLDEKLSLDDKNHDSEDKQQFYNMNKFVDLDFSNMKITNLFKRNHIRNCNFQKSEFIGSGFSVCEIGKQTNFSKTKFNSSVISRCNLKAVNFTKANIKLLNMKWSNLKDVDLSGSITDEMYVSRCNLDRSQLNNVNFNKLQLKANNFSQCDFKDTIFSECEIKRCNFRKTIFKNCTFKESFFKSCHLRGAIFSNCKFDRISYNFAKVNGAKITEDSILK